jgi:hypothetical protein
MSPTQLSTQCVDDDCISERGVKSLSFRSEEPRHAEGRTKKLNVFARWVSYSTRRPGRPTAFRSGGAGIPRGQTPCRPDNFPLSVQRAQWAKAPHFPGFSAY